MKTIVLGIAMTMAMAAVGCAHGTGERGPKSADQRGFTQVGRHARVVLAGPALLVHATGEKPVRWFVAERVQGDDRDCANKSSTAVMSESTRASVTVGSEHVLCAAVADGATDVNWHKLPEPKDGLWALR